MYLTLNFILSVKQLVNLYQNIKIFYIFQFEKCFECTIAALVTVHTYKCLMNNWPNAFAIYRGSVRKIGIPICRYL